MNFHKSLHSCEVLGTSRYNIVYGLINTSVCALIMLSAFVTDKESKKFLKRKIQVWREKMSMMQNQVGPGVIQAPACRSFPANDLYVINI